ncbi:protein LST8 homolog [Anopheles nili]|uniref:protein LST8 homolog n=1 Tax=Anopheles nili TaxID=185578 RepID=UPI00237A352D|nr:protein LST8 homolog [Anopheles nili]
MATDPMNEPILVTGSYDHTIRVWQPFSALCLRNMQHVDSQVNSLDIASKRNLLAASGYQHIRLYDLNSNYPIMDYDAVKKNITRVGFPEDGKWIFTGGEDGKVRIWDMNSQTLICQRIFDCQNPVNAVCLLPNQFELLMAHQGGGIYLWDVKSDQHDHLLPEVECSILDVAVSPNGAYMAAINNKGNCFIWTLSSWSGPPGPERQLTRSEAKLKIPAHEKCALRCKFSPDSSLLVTCSGDSTARVYRTDNWTLFAELRIDRYWMWDVAFNNDSKYLFTASSDNMARLWRIDTKTVEREYAGHLKPVTALAFRDEPVRSTTDTTGTGLSSTH